MTVRLVSLHQNKCRTNIKNNDVKYKLLYIQEYLNHSYFHCVFSEHNPQQNGSSYESEQKQPWRIEEMSKCVQHTHTHEHVMHCISGTKQRERADGHTRGRGHQAENTHTHVQKTCSERKEEVSVQLFLFLFFQLHD